ncbi:LamG domain-containing protein, partial [Verrucomicrobiales bacterium]|nr:LamG domain-containing protein [Verrucomicrobiales bacterium]
AEGAGVTDNVSPARRVAFPMTDSSFDSLTDEGKQLFVNSIRWAAGGDSPPTGLDGYWSFDEGTGTVAGDGSGNGRDAAFRNGEPMWVAGKSGGALAFDGDDDLTIAGWKGIGGAAPRTISYWMKTDWGVSSVGGNVAWGTSETGLKWHFRLNENANNGPVGAIRTEIQGSFHISTQVVNDDVWHHVVSIFPEGGQFMQDLVHYIDGELQEVGGTGSTTVEVDTAGEANGGTDVTFGSRLQGATDQYYIGAMDDISIWSRALTAEEVQALSKGATPLDVAAGSLDVVTSDGLPPLTSVNRTASGVAISVPDGETYDIQYSTDLIEWESIAPGTTGAYEDTDAGRTGGASGYYRGIQP